MKKTHVMKLMIVAAAFTLLTLPEAWGIEGKHMGGVPGGGGMMGGGMMGGQFRAADLDGDNIPEIVTITYGTYLTILDNEGNVISSKPLPPIPGQLAQVRSSGSIDVADMDDDGDPEIITICYSSTYGPGNYYGSYGRYLVILDSQGNLESYKLLNFPF